MQLRRAVLLMKVLAPYLFESCFGFSSITPGRDFEVYLDIDKNYSTRVAPL